MALRWSTSSVLRLSSNGCATASRKTNPFLGSRAFAFLRAPLCVQSLPLSTTVAALPLPVPVLDPRVVSTSIKASFNLISLCGFVILMQKYGHLPSNTAQVLSQVSFNLAIPCFLMSKVSKTIALQQDWRFLSLPLIALIQVTVGGLLGKLACFFLYKSSNIHSSDGRNSDLLAKEALITTACAFGNAVTLPLVFLNGMLSKFDYSAAAGYLALYITGWSPCLWTLGYQILNSTSGPLPAVNKNSEFSLHELFKWCRKVLNPPLYGILIGILVGTISFSDSFLASNYVFDAKGISGFLLSIRSLMESILQSISEGANLLGLAAVPLQTIVLASTLASSISKADNKERPVSGMEGAATSLHGEHTANVTVLEGKAIWAITVIRLLVIPLLSFISLQAFQHHRWLPADPVSRLVLLVVAATPTAQNLVVLVQLHPNTRPFAGVLANVLVRQYLISIVSLTLWLPMFFSFLRLHWQT